MLHPASLTGSALGVEDARFCPVDEQAVAARIRTATAGAR
jgi:hypothetical protein